jgi:hypothetical protein
VIFLPPEWGPAERLAYLANNAIRWAQDPATRARAAVVRATWSGLDLRGAPPITTGLLHEASSSAYPGDTERDGRRGQWVRDEPLWVLRHGGDCVERSHALVALALAAGLPAAFAWCTMRAPAPLDHVVCVIAERGSWWWCDPLVQHAMPRTTPPCTAWQTSQPLES